ncbi:hypothetical protein [Carnimonas bestiolae]|uniref:hypothetical protein n=1 Tax=Carnimonas bestiolae TaxID=3402172 RepID=UPI003EDC4FBB
MTSGIEAIAAERERQIVVRGYDAEHDMNVSAFDLISASYCYIHAARRTSVGYAPPVYSPLAWPWDEHHWKPGQDPRRNLEKAGALIAAAIDRLDAEGSQHG